MSRRPERWREVSQRDGVREGAAGQVTGGLGPLKELEKISENNEKPLDRFGET